MQIRLWLESVGRVLNEVGGYFTFSSDGQEYVVLRKEEWEAGRREERQGELALAEREEESQAHEVLEKINRDIALYRLRQYPEEVADEQGDDGGTWLSEDHQVGEIMPGAELPGEEGGGILTDESDESVTRVRFEPLRGDLPPELQE